MGRAPKLPTPARPTTRPRPVASMFGELSQIGGLRTVPLAAISANPRQPRKRFDPDSLRALADSVARRGVLQPPVVRERGGGGYELIAGERRWRAARIAGLQAIDVLVKVSDDVGALEDAVLENVSREDLSPVELARAYATMIDDLAISKEEIGRRLGQSRESISNHVRLLDLPEVVLELIDSGALSFAHGRALLLSDDLGAHERLARQALAGGWSTRQLEQAVRAAGAPRARRRAPPRPSAEQQALARHLTDAIAAACDIALDVTAGPNERFTFTVNGRHAARMIAARLGAETLEESR